MNRPYYTLHRNSSEKLGEVEFGVHIHECSCSECEPVDKSTSGQPGIAEVRYARAPPSHQPAYRSAAGHSQQAAEENANLCAASFSVRCPSRRSLSLTRSRQRGASFQKAIQLPAARAAPANGHDLAIDHNRGTQY